MAISASDKLLLLPLWLELKPPLSLLGATEKNSKLQRANNELNFSASNTNNFLSIFGQMLSQSTTTSNQLFSASPVTISVLNMDNDVYTSNLALPSMKLSISGYECFSGIAALGTDNSENGTSNFSRRPNSNQPLEEETSSLRLKLNIFLFKCV